MGARRQVEVLVLVGLFLGLRNLRVSDISALSGPEGATFSMHRGIQLRLALQCGVPEQFIYEQ